MARTDPLETTTIWQAVSRCLMWAVAIVCVCICLALFKPQMTRRAQLDARIADLRSQKERAKLEEEELRKRLDWIKSDPGYLEVYARDFLDLAREGETVFHFPPSAETR